MYQGSAEQRPRGPGGGCGGCGRAKGPEKEGRRRDEGAEGVTRGVDGGHAPAAAGPRLDLAATRGQECSGAASVGGWGEFETGSSKIETVGGAEEFWTLEWRLEATGYPLPLGQVCLEHLRDYDHSVLSKNLMICLVLNVHVQRTLHVESYKEFPQASYLF